jgi:stalled ribosome rescue protein Dom34
LKGSYEARQVPADDSRQRALSGKLNRYYDTVIEALRGCENLILFGPGEAKGELQKRLAKIKPELRVAAVETTDKMTDPQISAKVRAHFADAAIR